MLNVRCEKENRQEQEGSLKTSLRHSLEEQQPSRMCENLRRPAGRGPPSSKSNRPSVQVEEKEVRAALQRTP